MEVVVAPACLPDSIFLLPVDAWRMLLPPDDPRRMPSDFGAVLVNFTNSLSAPSVGSGEKDKEE